MVVGPPRHSTSVPGGESRIRHDRRDFDVTTDRIVV